MNIEKRLAQIISILFHPLLMPSLGMLILLNSGSYLSLIPGEAKRAVFIVFSLSTFVFPASLLPVLYFRRLISDFEIHKREERFLPYSLILILYIISFIFIYRLPLNSYIHAYALTLPVLVALLIIGNIRFRLNAHMMALGGLSGLIIALTALFGIPLQSYFIGIILATGLTGTARKILANYSSFELFGGFCTGFGASVLIMLLF